MPRGASNNVEHQNQTSYFSTELFLNAQPYDQELF